MAEPDGKRRGARGASTIVRHALTGIESFEATWSNYRTPHHAHPEYQITWTLEGLGRMEYRGGVARIPAGCAALFHPAEAHVLESAERGKSWHVRSLHVPEAILERAGVPLYQPAPFLLFPSLAAVVLRVWTTLAENAPGLERDIATLAALLCGLPGLEAAREPSSRVVRPCLTHLASVLDRQVTVAELAALTGCTAARVRRLFVAATGLPPHAWHLQRRIQHAKHLLLAGRPAAAVALHTGFADQAHFTRHFSVLVGVSPARYAASAGASAGAP